MRSVKEDVEAVGRIPVVPTILEVMVRTTGMRFAAVARVTDTSWTACAVRDEVAFGLKPGGELVLETTICNEIRQHRETVIFSNASLSAQYRDHHTTKMYGLESYISIPILRADGTFFGTLCAIDPKPAPNLDDPNVRQTLALFAQMIALHLDMMEHFERRGDALAAATGTARQLGEENRRINAEIGERDHAEEAMRRELKDTRRLRDVAARLIATEDYSSLFDEILDAAIEITGADAGTIQRLDPATQTLSFLAARGFSSEILLHFGKVDAGSGSSCGVALAGGARAYVHFDPASPDPDGAIRWHLEAGLASAQSAPLLSRSGERLGMFSTHWRTRRTLTERELRFLDLLGRQAADLIERSQVHEALRASERELREGARRKDEFLAVLAHELRNPLAPIRNGIKLLERARQQPELIEQVRPMMERQVGHMVRLIDDLLDVSRITSGKVELKREPVNLSSLVGNAVEANRAAIAAAGLELEVQMDDPGRRLDIDLTRMSQVISNILHNATKFTPSGGRISLRTELAPAGERQHSGLLLRIADTGIGIPADQLEGVFELFNQGRLDSIVRHGGLGIGLSLARSLVELHGGTIAVRSDGPGLGSEFTIRIPLPVTAVAGLATPQAAAPEDLGGLRVLVVDDNRDAADSIGLLIQHFGGQTRVTYDAASALAVAREFQPALVLLDIGMPDIDGYEACRRIRREHGAAMRIVALTGWGQEEDRRRSAEAGFDTHLTKPVDFNQLAAIAAAAMSAAPAPLLSATTSPAAASAR